MALGYTYVDFDALKIAIKQLGDAKTHLSDELKTINGIVENSVNNPQIYLSHDAQVTADEFKTMYTKWAQRFDDFVQEYIDYFNNAKAKYEDRAAKEAESAKKLNSFID